LILWLERVIGEYGRQSLLLEVLWKGGGRVCNYLKSESSLDAKVFLLGYQIWKLSGSKMDMEVVRIILTVQAQEGNH
jgi:hypothetical protein